MGARKASLGPRMSPSVIGAAFDNWMIRPGWKIGVSDPSTVTMGQIVDHIDHICQLAGNANHVGIGSDFDEPDRIEARGEPSFGFEACVEISGVLAQFR